MIFSSLPAALALCELLPVKKPIGRPEGISEPMASTQCAPERAFRFEVALSADDSGDNDWVVNHLCPRCECASPPVLDAGRSPKRPSGHRTANAQYDPSAP